MRSFWLEEEIMRLVKGNESDWGGGGGSKTKQTNGLTSKTNVKQIYLVKQNFKRVKPKRQQGKTPNQDSNPAR